MTIQPRHSAQKFTEINGPFAANGHMVQRIHHAGERAMCWDIQNKENSSLTG